MTLISQGRFCFSVIVLVMIGFLVIVSTSLPMTRCYSVSGSSFSLTFGSKIQLASSQTDGTNVSGYLATNTTWSREAGPYLVTGTVIVEEGVELTIEAGTVVRFASGTSLVVDGILNATGYESQRILFTSDSSSPMRGDWGTIEIGSFTRQTGRVSNITFWTVEYSNLGIQYVGNQTLLVNETILRYNDQGLLPHAQATYVENCEVVNNNVGIFSQGALTVRNSIISGNGLKGPPDQGGGILGGDIRIKNCTFSNNFNMVVESPRSITNSTFSGNPAYFLGQDAELISDCTIVNNSRSFVRTQVMEHCNISWNGEVGDPGRIVDSIITHNQKGLHVFANSIITHCVIANNNGPGIVPNYGDSKPFEIHYCSIYNNSNYDLTLVNVFNPVEMVGSDINATYNWWGTTDLSLVGDHIYDYYDDYNLGRVFFEPLLASPYFAEVGGKIYDIGVSGNSTVSNFFFYRAEKSILFDASGLEPTGGNFTISIPNSLMWGEFTVSRDDELLTEGSDYMLVSNSTHFILNFTADSIVHSFRIESSQVLPEFSFHQLWVVLSVLIIAFAIRRKLKMGVRRESAGC